MRRTAVTAAALLLLSASPHARAARQDPVPPPTVDVAVTVQGQLVTKKAVQAAWTYDERGHLGQLDVDGISPPGGVLTVDALWTSKDFLALRQFPQLVLEATTSHAGAPSSSMPASFTYGYRFRDAGRAWGTWQDTSVSAESGSPLTTYSLKQQPVFAPGTPLKGKRVQVQWRLHIESADPGRTTQQWVLRTNQP
jgi:hypothetical protein